jgi:hypothetical protein
MFVVDMPGGACLKPGLFMKTNYVKAVVSVVLLSIGLAAARADRIELSDGSVILGKLLSAEGGKIKFETTFAGTIEIAQAKVKSFSTDEAVNVGLAAGSQVLGKVEATDAGIKVVATDGQMSAETGKVAAVWRQGADSPEVRKLKAEADAKTRKWAYEAAVAIAGRTGVAEKFGANLGFKATLASAQDKLVFAVAAEKARDSGVETANRQFGSVDYSSFYTPDNGWYVRTSIEKDTIKQLDLRSNTAFGFGRKLVKNAKEDLELRVGVDYLYETYSNNTKFDSPGLDIALLYSYQFTTSKFVNNFVYAPSFKDFSNYRVHDEAGFEIPLAASMWKLKLGVAGDYNSRPPDGVNNLDVTYFTSLLLNWK